MAGPEPLPIFLDTNVLLHFRRIEEIDWCGLARASACELVTTPILFRELERQKAVNRSSRLRRRAAEAVDYLADLIEGDSPHRIREGVHLGFMDREPLIDFAAHGLAWEVNDDQLIAGALDYSNETGRRVAIATGDRGLALKLRARPIELVRLPDDLRLPAAAEADAVELRRLQLEIAELKNRLPKLAVSFANGETCLGLARPRAPSEKLASLEEVRARYRPVSLPPAGDSGRYGELLEPLGPTSDYSRYLAEQYNSELASFLASYAEYELAWERWRESVGLIVELDFSLANLGRGPATNVDLHVEFPEGFGLFDIDSKPRRPEAPQPPDPTGTRMFNRSAFRLGPAFAIGPKPPRDGLPQFEPGGRRLAYRAETLKHGCTLHCEPVMVRVRSVEDLRPFQLDVSITCNETQGIESRLAVLFID